MANAKNLRIAKKYTTILHFTDVLILKVMVIYIGKASIIFKSKD